MQKAATISVFVEVQHDFQYFGLGAVRLWAKGSQGVWDKILYLISGFWENLGFVCDFPGCCMILYVLYMILY